MPKDDPAMFDLGYPREALDLYETPADVAAVLALSPLAEHIRRRKVWEPAVGRGALLGSLASVARKVVVSDIHDHAGLSDLTVADMLTMKKPLAKVAVTNPPYVLAHEFAQRMLDWIDEGRLDTAILLTRATWSHTVGRNWMMNHPAMAREVRLSWRPRWIADSTGSPRHDYMWLVWDRASIGQPAEVRYVSRP